MPTNPLPVNFDPTAIRRIARRTLEIEAKTIVALSESIDDDFVRCVEHILRTSGRVIVTGVGKSAIIAQKIVGTLNSTGTPAIFMHAADAAHGDLGMVRKEDIILVISRSGSTEEIKVIVPMIRRIGGLLVAMVGSAASYLAKQADLILKTPVAEEADPNNLAPTASTAAQMALGDALAMALLQSRGFSIERFAKLHPGGALGKQLHLRVRDLAVLHEKPAVGPTANIRTVILEISSKRLGIAVVVDDNQALRGVITDGDLRRMLETNSDVGHLTAADIMTVQPKTIDANALAVEALTIMRSHSITQLIVLDEARYFGVVHIHDLVREGLV